MSDQRQPEAPPVTALRAYMRSDGWTEGGHGSHGSVFTKGDLKVAVPLEDDDPELTRIALYRLAQMEGRPPDETAAAVLAYRQMSEPAKACGCGPLEPCREHLRAEAHPGITRWRQKTPEIEATRWDGTAVDATRVINWILAAGGTARYHDEPPGFIALDIPGGMVRSLAGDWITACRDGSFRPLTEAGFFDLLEPVGVLVSGSAETDAAVPVADDTGQHPPTAHAQPRERTGPSSPDELADLHERISAVLGPRRRKLTEAVMAEIEQEAVNRMTERFVEETRIRSMDFRDGAALDLQPSREVVALWVGAARGMLGDAPNYSETEIDYGLADPPGFEMDVKLAGEVERYVFRLQRRGKLTPHQARKLAEERAEDAETKLAEVRSVLLEGGQGDATARCRAIAVVGTGDRQERSDEGEPCGA